MNYILQNQNTLTDRPAPILLGMYSVQAVASDPTKVDIVVYRSTSSEAVAWLKELSRSGGYARFLLTHNAKRYDVYSSSGEFIEMVSGNLPSTTDDSNEYLDIDHSLMLQESQDYIALNNLSLISCAEGHAGASAADHSNFAVLCRRMIGEASVEDLQHMVLLESKLWPCRVTGLYASMCNLSAAMQDIYLDRYEWVFKSWPLNTAHHRDLLAGRLAGPRQSYGMELLAECGAHAGMTHELILSMQAKWMLAPPSAQYRFARRIVECLANGTLYPRGKAETFSEEIVREKGAEVVSKWREMLR